MRRKSPDLQGGRPTTGHERGPGRIANRLLAIGPVKETPPGGEGIEGGRENLLVAHAAQVSSKIIGRDEENVEPLRSFRPQGREKKADHEEET